MAPAGSPDTTLTINGGNFESAVPLANGVPLPIVSLNNTQLVTTLPESMLQNPGTINISVGNLLQGGNIFSNVMPFVVSGGTAMPVLSISKTHTGNFTQGQTGANYAVTVGNIGTVPTDGGQVTFTDTLPTGLMITGMNGSGWGCTAPPTCMRSDVLAGGGSYPPIRVTVNVATNAPSTVTNVGSVSGGGSAPATSSDVTTITGSTAPALAISAVTSSPTFPPGGTGTYTVTISNTGNATLAGPITVMATLDASEFLSSLGMSGTGWLCNNTNLSCTNNTPVPAGGTLPSLTVPVNISTSVGSSVSSTFIGVANGMTAMIKVTTPS